MKAHIRVDADLGLAHTTVIAAAGGVSDVSRTEKLLHEDERHLHADVGYQLGQEREQRLLEQGVEHQIKARSKGTQERVIQELDKIKASIRVKIEHPFPVAEGRFGCRKVCHSGPAKNLARLFALFMSDNLVIVKKWLLSSNRQSASAA